MTELREHRRWLGPAIALVGLVAVVYSVLAGTPAPASTGRGLVVMAALVTVAAAWLLWLALQLIWKYRAVERGLSPELFLMAAAGAFLASAQSSGSGASAATYVAMVSTGIRAGFRRGLAVAALAILANAVATLIYGASGVSVLVYSLSFILALLGGSSVRQSIVRADEAELLLAATQRSHEEELRAAKLQESTRIAREIHDLLAHTLSGLTIQLEAAVALLDSGAEAASLRDRLADAHRLAREGLAETRRAVGVLREEVPVPVDLEAELWRIVVDYQDATHPPRADVTVKGDPTQLSAGQASAILRVCQEAVTNVLKHAPGATLTVALQIGPQVILAVENGAPTMAYSALGELARSGGGFGIDGMRERAQILGGELGAGPTGSGWRVALRLPRVPAGDD